MCAKKIVQYYRSRFQIEFLYKDAKQHCGLTNCQSRSENKLNFHFNAALTAVKILFHKTLFRLILYIAVIQRDSQISN